MNYLLKVAKQGLQNALRSFKDLSHILTTILQASLVKYDNCPPKLLQQPTC